MKLDRKVLYELDGGDRTKVKAFEVEVEPGAVSVCVPDRRAVTHGEAVSGFAGPGETPVSPPTREVPRAVFPQVSETAS